MRIGTLVVALAALGAGWGVLTAQHQEVSAQWFVTCWVGSHGDASGWYGSYTNCPGAPNPLVLSANSTLSWWDPYFYEYVPMSSKSAASDGRSVWALGRYGVFSGLWQVQGSHFVYCSYCQPQYGYGVSSWLFNVP